MYARIIPARAGFTGRVPHTEEYNRDHPRSRGVYPPFWESPREMRGSSPLARGLRFFFVADMLNDRIIPARAGFTAGRSRGGASGRDHPRSRGVYLNAAASASTSIGSSPLARGLLCAILGRIWLGRIIPARAGFTGVGCAS